MENFKKISSVQKNNKIKTLKKNKKKNQKSLTYCN